MQRLSLVANFRSQKKDAKRVIADFQGGDAESGLVGIMLWERDGQLSELEAWSIDGRDISAWPALATFRQLEIVRVP